jgi:hypothetical protein
MTSFIKANVSISVDDIVDDSRVHYLAAAPPDMRMSHYGSGMPFVSREQAMCNTPNHGVVTLDKNLKATISLIHPNSYYDQCLNVVPPRVELTYLSNGNRKKKVIRIRELKIHGRSLYSHSSPEAC